MPLFVLALAMDAARDEAHPRLLLGEEHDFRGARNAKIREALRTVQLVRE